jgi:hypothetical protein
MEAPLTPSRAPAGRVRTEKSQSGQGGLVASIVWMRERCSMLRRNVRNSERAA